MVYDILFVLLVNSIGLTVFVGMLSSRTNNIIQCMQLAADTLKSMENRITILEEKIYRLTGDGK